jgi:hypothetical protein
MFNRFFVNGFHSYIVVEIPEPVRSAVQSLRNSLGTSIARLPVEITIAGSSGVGPIRPDADSSLVERNLFRVLSQCRAFATRFSAIRCFPNTSIYYLEPADRASFDQLHQAVCTSGIPFSKSPWPYNPHCTLCAGERFSPDAVANLLETPIPQDEFQIGTIAIYGVHPVSRECRLLFQQTLQT